jgi:hypothetical protein
MPSQFEFIIASREGHTSVIVAFQSIMNYATTHGLGYGTNNVYEATFHVGGVVGYRLG